MSKQHEQRYKGKECKKGGKIPSKYAPKTNKEDGYKVEILTNKRDNDVAYYKKYLEDYNNSMNYPWFKIIGRPLDVNAFSQAKQMHTESISFPQIMRINFVPTIGKATQSTDPVNKCFNIIMADLYAKTSSVNLSFQAADLAMEQVCLATAIAGVGQLTRALECTDFWINKNNTYPKALLASMGYDWDDLTTNKAQYVTKLNALIHQINNMQLPKFLDFTQLEYTRTHSVYVDEDNEYGQIYYFWMTGYYDYDDTEMKATFKEFLGGAETSLWLSHLQQLQSIINKWYNSSDFYLINGALLRAYKSATLFSLPDVTLTGMISPTCEKTIMMQIMNMDIGNATDFDITQDPEKNAILCSPKALGHGHSRLIRWYDTDDAINIDDKCEMTRLCYTTTGGGLSQNVESCGCEIVTNVSIYALDPSNYSSVVLLGNVVNETDPGDTNVSGLLSYILACNFRYAPRMVVKVGNSYCCMGDVYNYTTVPTYAIKNMNTVAMYSLWKPELPNDLR